MLTIRAVRRSRGITLVELALLAGIPVRVLGAIEHGLLPLDSDSRERLGIVLDLAPDLLLSADAASQPDAGARGYTPLQRAVLPLIVVLIGVALLALPAFDSVQAPAAAAPATRTARLSAPTPAAARSSARSRTTPASTLTRVPPSTTPSPPPTSTVTPPPPSETAAPAPELSQAAAPTEPPIPEPSEAAAPIEAPPTPEPSEAAVPTAEPPTPAPSEAAVPTAAPPAAPPAPSEGTAPTPAFTLGPAGPYGCPLAPGAGHVVITQGYGVGTHAPASIWGALDLGIDSNGDGFAEPDMTRGVAVVTTRGGVAHVFMGSWPGGNYIRVEDAAAGWSTAYAHLDTVAVADGQQLADGELIGTVGSTGFATGPHLHYEVWHGAENVDPTGLLTCP